MNTQTHSQAPEFCAPGLATVSPLRRFLDGLYNFCGGIAAMFLLAILSIIVLQMMARWGGIQFPGSANYAGYCMAAASFFALAYTLNHDAHIRVTLFLSRLTGWPKRLADIWCLGVATFFSAYMSWFAVKNVYVSHLIHDISQGQDAMPLWIPQLPVAIGSCIFTLALVDHLVRTLRGADDTFTDQLPVIMED